jgi:hypothetical protein
MKPEGSNSGKSDHSPEYRSSVADKLYDELGIAPPSVEKHGTEADRDEAMARERSSRRCHWVQRGKYIECSEHDWGAHGLPIRTDQILQGTDEKGHPILTEVVVNPKYVD